MKYQEILAYGVRCLQENGISDASMDAWLLLEKETGMNRASYLLHRDELMQKEHFENYKNMLEQRAKHIPLQHITGEQEFMGIPFYVNEHVLIPRQDTEVLVEYVLSVSRPGVKLLDLCTGSGCIAISLQKNIENSQVQAADISVLALETAKKNALRNQTEVQFIESDLFSNINETFDIIVANPPYIKTEIIAQLMEEVKDHEPVLALDGREDGLFFYREIIRQSNCFLEKNGILCFEIGLDQGDAVTAIMKEFGFLEVMVKKDLTGRNRMVTGVFKG